MDDTPESAISELTNEIDSSRHTPLHSPVLRCENAINVHDAIMDVQLNIQEEIEDDIESVCSDCGSDFTCSSEPTVSTVSTTPLKKSRVYSPMPADEWKKVEFNEVESVSVGHVFKYTIPNVGRVKECVMHSHCKHLIKEVDKFNARPTVFQCGVHTTCLVAVRRGIHPFLLPEIDEACGNGVFATRIYNRLVMKYKSRDDVRSILPSIAQINTRKKALLRPSIRLDTVASLKSYMNALKVCTYIPLHCPE